MSDDEIQDLIERLQYVARVFGGAVEDTANDALDALSDLRAENKRLKADLEASLCA
jgi:hypothetical protein